MPHASVVKAAIAARIRRLPPCATAQDMEEAAWLAYHRFMERDVRAVVGEDCAKLVHVAVRRGMQDELRRLDPLGRRLRSQARRLRRISDSMAQQLGREPTVAEIAQQAGIREKIARRALEAAQAEASEFRGELCDRTLETLMSDRAESVDALGVEEVLTAELGKLPRDEAEIIRLTVIEGLPVAHVAKRLGVTAYKLTLARDRALQCLRESPSIRELAPA